MEPVEILAIVGAIGVSAVSLKVSSKENECALFQCEIMVVHHLTTHAMFAMRCLCSFWCPSTKPFCVLLET